MARQYEIVELMFTAPAPAGSHVWVNLEAAFDGPGGSKTVKGFYAGENTYKVRFLPEQPGLYRYQVSGILSQKGTVEVLPAEDGNHGPVRAEGSALYYADGTPFFGFGTTVYGLVHQSKELVEETMASLQASPFNKIRFCVFPKHFMYNTNEPECFAFEKSPEHPYERPAVLDDPMRFAGDERMDGTADPVSETSTMDCETAPKWDVDHPVFAFWDALEKRIRQLGQTGIEADLILFHPYDRWGFSCMSREENQTYLEYALRRLAAFPNLWWSLSNEYDFTATKTPEDWEAFGEKIGREDPFRHLLGNHNGIRIYDPGKPYITHASLQEKNMALVPELQERYQKPVCVDECCYEGDIEPAWGSISGREMTRRFWKVTTGGGHCTHGETFTPADDNVIWWARGGKLQGESVPRIAFLRGIAESLPGPLVPTPAFFNGLLAMPEETIGEVYRQMPPMLVQITKAVRAADKEQVLRHFDAEYSFSSHVGEEAFLWYLDIETHRSYTIRLPKEHTYTVEVIDTWEMTREVVSEDACGAFSVPLPAKEGMAVLARRNR